MAKVLLSEINKLYKNGFHAVKDFNMEIQDGEFIIFVGPSGCGKSTTLRMIAGLEDITSGELQIDGKRMNYADPKDRGLSMVFQNYALYPYMNVYENMAFSLRCAKMDRQEMEQRVHRAADMLQIEHLLKRKPGTLSGGQKQRVAIGSVLVREQGLFLMDEPLSNLDARLRTQMRSWLAKLHKQLGVTIIYVTHDQVEAMTLGSRIVVMKEGEIHQIASPGELYHNPVNQFVASFIGAPTMNFIPVEVVAEEGEIVLKCGNSGTDKLFISSALGRRLQTNGYMGKMIILGVRAEDLYIESVNEQKNCRLSMQVSVRENLGAELLVHGEINGEPACARVKPGCMVKPGETVWMYPDMTKVKLFDCATEENILYEKSSDTKMQKGAGA